MQEEEQPQQLQALVQHVRYWPPEQVAKLRGSLKASTANENADKTKNCIIPSDADHLRLRLGRILLRSYRSDDTNLADLAPAAGIPVFVFQV